jgi:dTDP-4-dehydrorhamnose reductase
MRLIVTGTAEGQLVGSLIERAPSANAEIVAVGIPELDMSDPSTIAPALAGIKADVIVNAAAFTAVDKAESNEALAMRINGDAAGEAARVARRQNLPLLHISTDYVFDGSSPRPYREDDLTGPTSAYGRTKLAGERAVLDADPTATILRTAWVYSPFSVNFVKTMLRLGETRTEVSVVADQRGNPSYALDLADAVLSIARQRLQRRSERFGVGIYHMTGSGDATWADLAEEVFAEAQRLGRPPVKVKRIPSAEYPTPTRRPANSQLDNAKLARVFGVVLPDWRASTRDCVKRLLVKN